MELNKESSPVLKDNLPKQDESMDQKTAAGDYEATLEQLASWEEELNKQEEELKDRAGSLGIKEKKLAIREKSIAEREKKLSERESNLAADSEKLQNEKNETQKTQAKAEGQLKAIEQAKEELSKIKTDLENREAEIYSKEQAKQVQELSSQAESMDAFEKQMNELREQIRQEFLKESENRRNKLNAELNQRENEVNKRLADKEAELNERELKLVKDQRDSDFRWKRLKKLEESLEERESSLNDEVKTNMSDYRRSHDEALQRAQDESAELRDKLNQAEKELYTDKDFIARFGDDPRILSEKLNSLKQQNDKLAADLATRPGPEKDRECAQLKEENNTLKFKLETERNDNFEGRKQLLELESLRKDKALLDAELETWKSKWESSQDVISNQEAQIRRLTATEVTPADRDKRAASLHEPYLTNAFDAPLVSAKDASGVNEVEWLEQIYKSCKQYGLQFPHRILYAFHTSLKIANWSSLSVLAGVSGTGKSELPHLYARFGGLNFINVPVQPNWDSQESMLGFFNSIDNKFDAQPVLRFLVECTEKYKNNMAIVLLDEMNLAHVEHYFADFLSKLEMRRSSSDDKPQVIEVSLGAGVQPYQLPLSPNVLWCGTMNQDETTKSLSDKVLDRGTVIHFPRPRHLIGRSNAMKLDVFCDRILPYKITPMSLTTWNSWRMKRIPFIEKSQQQEELDRYRKLLEEMNESLSHAGRAIGHRVWQAIEHYTVNHPLVIKAYNETLRDGKDGKKHSSGELTKDLRDAMHLAVEDQIVQKVMPKLRGIDTRGTTREDCLDPIGHLIDNEFSDLTEDFKLACEMGYGQFMWNSAEYISKGNDLFEDSEEK